jgi:hypothetical protein
VLDGTGASNTTGIAFNSGGRLIVQDSVIRNFAGNGLSFLPNASTPSQLFVSNTLVSDNGANGIAMTAGSNSVGGVLSRVNMEGNAAAGLVVKSLTGAFNNVTVSDSVASGNVINGILVTDAAATVMVRNSTITNNGTGLEADNSSVIRVTRSTMTGNGTAWVNLTSGTVFTFGDNDIVSNFLPTPPPSSTVGHE